MRHLNNFFIITIFCVLCPFPSVCQVSIAADNSPADNSAILDVKSNSKGVLVPRMTISERNSISNPAAGLMIYCTDNNQYYFNKGTSSSPGWLILNSQWVTVNSNIAFNTGNVGIGTTSPNSLLSVGNNSQLQVNSSGNITRINNVTTNWPSVQGSANSSLQNDGAGNLTWVTSSLSGVKQVIRGVITTNVNTSSTFSQSFSPSVVPSKSVCAIRYILSSSSGGSTQANFAIVSALSSSSISVQTASGMSGTHLVEYQIIEYY